MITDGFAYSSGFKARGFMLQTQIIPPAQHQPNNQLSPSEQEMNQPAGYASSQRWLTSRQASRQSQRGPHQPTCSGE